MPTGLPNARVFLSYSRVDFKVVQEIYRKLRGAGFRPWMDRPPREFRLEGMAPGMSWREEASRQIRESDFALIFFSKTSVSKEGYANKELRQLLDRQSKIPARRVFLIPVRIDDCEVPDLLVHTVRVADLDVYDLWQDGSDLLIEFLAGKRDLDRAPLPAVGGPATGYWNVPNQNPDFVGREKLLNQLISGFQQSQGSHRVLTVSGLGGIGKTQIAIELCHRIRRDYPTGLFWADASSVSNLLKSYAEFAFAMGWANDKTTVDDSDIWLRRIGTRPGWLLVLDNADAPGEIDTLLPKTTDGHVLVTTRHPDPGWGDPPLRPKELTPEDATEFLQSRARRNASEADACLDLAMRLDRIPLALEQAAAYLVQHPAVSVDRYLKGLEEQNVKFLEEHRSRRLRGDYPKSVAATWQLSFDALPEPAMEAMNALAFLESDSIPLSFFTRAKGLGPSIAKLDLEDSLTVSEKIIEPMTRYSLAELRKGSTEIGRDDALRIHHLVQEVALYRLETSLHTEILERVHKTLDDCFPKRPQHPNAWNDAVLWIPHVLRTREHWQQIDPPPSWDPSSLWSRAARGQQSAGKALVALELQEQILELRRHRLGEHHPKTLKALEQLAESHRLSGQLEKAKTLHQSALDRRRQELGPTHVDTLFSLRNLALTHRGLGSLRMALDLLEEAVQTSQKTLGDQHPNTLEATTELASTLRALGRVDQARELMERTLDESRRLLGDRHPDTLAAINQLAIILRTLNENEPARELQQEALETSRVVLGEEHPDTLAASKNLGAILRTGGHIKEAREVQEEAFEVTRRVLGDEHPETLSAANNLSSTLAVLGRRQEALELQLTSLKTSRGTLGNQHPITFTAINNLALILRGLGKTADALRLQEEALDISRHLLGEQHPDTLAVINNLGLTLKADGQTREAFNRQKELLDLSRRVLGSEHPTTLSTLNNLASTCLSLGNPQEALELQEEALLTRRSTLGERHPSVLISASNMAYTLRRLDRAVEARELLEKVAQTSRETLGTDHSTTLSISANLASTLVDLGETEAAEQLYGSVLETRKRTLGPNHPMTLSASNRLAEIYRVSDRVERARQLHLETFESRKKVLGEKHPSTLNSLHNFLLTIPKQEVAEVHASSVQELLAGVHELPEGMEIRVKAEAVWSGSG